MDVLLALAFVVAAAFGLWSNLATLLEAWRRNRTAFLATMKLIAAYVIYCAVGIGLVVTGLDGPQAERRALGGTLFLLAWIFYGSAWLARTAPRSQPIPVWLERFPGPVDVVLVGAICVGAFMYFS